MKFKSIFFYVLCTYLTLGILNPLKANAKGALCELPPTRQYTVYNSPNQPRQAILRFTTGPMGDGIWDVEMATKSVAPEKWNRIAYIFPNLRDRRESVSGYIFIPNDARCVSPDAASNDD
jgi:hypothetical protein